MKHLISKLQQGNNLPTAPRAEIRYNNGKTNHRIVKTQDKTFAKVYPEIDIKKVIANDKLFPSTIEQHIYRNISPQLNDTAYIETPGRDNPFTNVFPRRVLKHTGLFTQRFSYPNGPIGGRYWSGKKINPQEFQILKRRFNTAWNINSK